MKRPDVAFVLPALHGGGVERVYLDLAGGLAAKGLRVDMVLAKAEGAFLSHMPEGVGLVDLGVPRKLRLLRSYGALRAYLQERRPRVVVPVWGYLDAVPLWASWENGLPVLWVLHNAPAYFRDLPLPKRQVAVWSARWALRRAASHPRTRIGAVSQGVARAFSLFADIPEASIKVLPNPISAERIHLLANESLPLLPFLGEDPYWVAVGRLHPQKGFELLIRAFALFSGRYPDSRVHLLLLGEGPQRPRLEILIRQLGLQDKVHLLGHVPNPYPYMRRARGLLLASRYEGLPTVVLEALVLGVPVLATEAEGGLREALGNGSFGLVVPRTLEALAEGMVRLWRGEINLSAQTLADHLAVYTLSAAVKAYTNLFEEIWS